MVAAVSAGLVFVIHIHWLDRRQRWKKLKTTAFLTGILEEFWCLFAFSDWKNNSLFQLSDFQSELQTALKYFIEFRSRFWNWNSGQKCSRLSIIMTWPNLMLWLELVSNSSYDAFDFLRSSKFTENLMFVFVLHFKDQKFWEHLQSYISRVL